jgi:hypothetical protein
MLLEHRISFIDTCSRFIYITKDEKTRDDLKTLRQHHLNELVKFEMDKTNLRKDQNV